MVGRGSESGNVALGDTVARVPERYNHWCPELRQTATKQKTAYTQKALFYESKHEKIKSETKKYKPHIFCNKQHYKQRYIIHP